MTTLSPLGAKHSCASCNARFYDLNRQPATCPKCSHVSQPVVKVSGRHKRRAAGERVLDGGDLLIQHMAATRPAKANSKKTARQEKEDFEALDASAEENTEELEEGEGEAEAAQS